MGRLAAATHLVVVQAEYRPGWPPAHEWAARAVAAAVAESVGGDVVDVFGLQFLDPATALRSLPDAQGRIRLVDWVLVPYSSDTEGLWFTTKGLRRFGLLELQTQGVPDHLTRAWGAVMTGAARRLLRDWTDGLAGDEVPAFVQLPVAGHGHRARHRGGVRQSGAARRHRPRCCCGWNWTRRPTPRLTRSSACVPPAGHPGPDGRYFAAACATLFSGIQPDVRVRPLAATR